MDRQPSLYVVKRDGRSEPMYFDKITNRITKLAYGLNPEFVDPRVVALKVIVGLYKGVATSEVDTLAAETAAGMTTVHPDYAVLAARIAISNLQKKTEKKFSTVARLLYSHRLPHTDKHSPMIAPEIWKIIEENADRLDAAIVDDRDFSYSFFGFKTLERSYLLKMNGKIVERPQHMLMRVAIGIHGEDIDAAIETYDMMSERYFTHASPTLFNSGTCQPQMSSCFLLTMMDDSIDGIFETMKRCALISKSAGGIGLNVHNIRAKGSLIAGTNGTSNGLVPMLKVFNNTAKYVDQGGNKRPGAFAIYLEPWHADIMEFLQLRLNTGSPDERARDLFYALWIPDLFMKRVEADAEWTLMCPKECPGLDDCYGEEFEKLYTKYEQSKRGVKTIKARDVWKLMINAQIETGTPYVLYKDACNAKSNQQNLGTIKCSNLCTEIVEYSSPDEVAVCNLASIALPRFVKEGGEFDFQKLREISALMTRNLNKIIDVNYYPIPEAERSNKRHRPIGLGVQGLADTFQIMKLPFTSHAARDLNKRIFETIYYASMEASCELAEKLGPYETYEGSPVSKGIFQFDMWGVTPTDQWNWKKLKEKVALHGVRNSLLLAPMPTASTAQILGNNESIEPYTSNIYNRRVLSGEYTIVNQHLLKDLVEMNIWNEEMKQELIRNNGSIQNIQGIPADMKELYKTVWELSQKDLVEMAADRGAFIDQSQSFNVHIAKPTFANVTSMHFYGWKKGLKTGMYYLRTRPAVDAVKFSVEKKETVKETLPVEEDEGCLMCSG
ncbi:hypothetical protein PRIPAC_75048 [Pristionchus pacificus]|uniref:Ribonucleoside-diphosphate reductase n=1 Tax=Pristionchus pacificus TaxID=54126 RepID=A0A2A6CFZ7_PRIPA|nr:hypothetical protein PRIPAC_75048 [Pristionchus pacificus]|eukprot:PDM77007.1 hypothetical protein PRIPAC_42402 [Pristionchus pacificus]